MERALGEVEPQARLERQRVAGIHAGEHVPEDPVVGGDVVLGRRGDLERVGEVAEREGLPGGKVPSDVVDRDDGLLEDVLADDAALADGVIHEPLGAMMLLTRE